MPLSNRVCDERALGENTMTIPGDVQAYLSRRTGNVERDDPEAVPDALDRLGIARDTELAAFYPAYHGPFISPRLIAELWDLLDYSSIVASLDYVRDRYEFPDHLLPLTSDESEGMYLYDALAGAVHDYDLTTHARFVAGEIDPRWATFSAFLKWYFDDVTVREISSA